MDGLTYNAIVDFYILSLCDHAIYDHGSFGFWAAALSEGEVLVAEVEAKISHPLTRALKQFTPAGWTIVNENAWNDSVGAPLKY